MLVFVIVLSLVHVSQQNADIFNEELYIRPLKSGHVNTFFQFTSRWNIETEDDCKKRYSFALKISFR